MHDNNKSELHLVNEQGHKHDVNRDQVSQGIKHRELHSLAYQDSDNKKNSQVVFPPLKRKY